MSTYASILRAREDMTEWLIHFTRASGNPLASNWLHASQVLAKIVKEGYLIPSWSLRNYRPTIYGPRPAVCFTEQPLWAFVQYMDSRGTGPVPGYGVLIRKRQASADGAYPVIYGCEPAEEIASTHPNAVPGMRILDPTHIPLDQQYRFSALALGKNQEPIDWSHEREWRWPEHDLNVQHRKGQPNRLPLVGSGWFGWRGSAHGTPHLFVPDDQARSILQNELKDLQPDASGDGLRADLHAQLKTSVGIICLDFVRRQWRQGDRRFGRLETWPADHPVALAGAPGEFAPASKMFESN
jgi:hypothetical protein